MNNIMYADDLCIFSPSVSGLRKLIDHSAEYSNMFDITYNANNLNVWLLITNLRTRKIVTLLLPITIHYFTLRNLKTLAILSTITLLRMMILPGRKYAFTLRQMF